MMRGDITGMLYSNRLAKALKKEGKMAAHEELKEKIYKVFDSRYDLDTPENREGEIHQDYQSTDEILSIVGEWLNERVMCEHLAYYHRRFTCEGCINQLIRGEMLEEEK